MSSFLAYLDPGTGSIILQSIVAGLLGIAVAIKMFWQRIIGFFRFRKQESAEGEDVDPKPEE